MYDIFYVSKNIIDAESWLKIKDAYPTAQKVENVKSFNDLNSRAFTKMFWVIWDDLELTNNLNLVDYRATEWDNMYVHVFKNGDFFDGICLFPKNKKISQREFDYRFFIDKKEIDTVASSPKCYDKFFIDTYAEYLDAIEQSTTDMFWIVWNTVEVTDSNIFNLYFSYHNSYDRNENHIFKNLCNNQPSYYNGIVLCSKNKPISKREITQRFLINKKEHDIIASRYKYPVYILNTYKEYIKILETETQPLFWCVWPEVEIIDESVFDLYFDPRDGKYNHDRNENHCFKHIFRTEETYSNGIVLFSKNKPISQKEFHHRFLINKKEHPEVVSKFKPYDIVFISYNEPNAEENYKNLLEKFTNAKRVDKVKGIHQAHIAAATIATTEMFWVVDGDAIINDDFMFNYETSTYERDIVHVWRSRNPINNLVYGYGGVKLLPREKTINMDLSKPDMTTSISKHFKAVSIISNITAFNTDPFNTWKSAFRECCKLSSKVIDRQNETETNARLKVWCTSGKDKPYGNFAIDGAIAGTEYGNANKDNLEALKKINDFDWLKEQFDARRLEN
jgi:hypothetical protein